MNNSLFSGSNLTQVKIHNLQAMLMSLLYNGEISRAEIAKRTSLSSATITNLASELIDQKIITEVEPGTSEKAKKRAVGRPQRMLRLIPDARYAIGVHIGVGLFRVAITNLHAEIINNSIVKFEQDTSALDVLTQITTEIESLIEDAAIDRKRILGVGVGASGLVNHEAGLNVMAPRLGWQNLNIQEIFQNKLSLSVKVDNNVRAMAIGEAFFGAGRDVNVLAFVYGRSGVGAGFVVNRQVYRGSGAGAGEIGHMIMIPEDGQLCSCGQKGCLETLVTEPVIVQRGIELAQQHPDSLLAQYLAQDDGTPLIDRLFAAAREGDQLTRKMIETQIHYLGIALANLVNILNPEMILLGGVFAQGDDLIRPVACRVMRETAFSDLGQDVIVEPTSFGWRAGVVGAAALALMDFFYQRTGGTT
jgi:predicted NBD/HSP70 family sugar kinase